MKGKAGIVLFAVAVALAGPARLEGQDVAPGRWWHDPSTVRDLTLSRREQRSLDDLYEKNRGALVDLKADLERERARLAELMRREPFDEASVNAQLRRVEQKQQRLTQERMKYLIEVRKILGPQRFRILEGKAPPERVDRPGHKGRDRGGPKW